LPPGSFEGTAKLNTSADAGRGESATPTVAIGQLATVLKLGDRTYDLATRALVMGILNRTPDSFYDHGATYELDALVERAAKLTEDGADVLDVGGVKAGPGPFVSEAEELDRVVPAIEALHSRFEVPLSADTWRASVARECFRAGAVLGNDISGFQDPGYLPAAAEAGASVVATHIRLAPRVRDPDPAYDDVVVTVCRALQALACSALEAGISADRVILDAGLDLGKTAEQSLELLRATEMLSSLGYPLLLSASNKTFLGSVLDLGVDQRAWASLAAAAMGVSLGARILRVHDVASTRSVRDSLSALLEARV
jgi:dihydropteroate synthase